MPTQQRHQQIDELHMQTAELYASLSRGIRAKVGCVVVTETGVILPGFNGTPQGMPNDLEYINNDGEYVTKPTVIHAELNCIMKAAREGVSVKNSKVYVTHSPCEACAAMLIQAGVMQVYYRQVYKDEKGLDVIKAKGIFSKLLEK